MADKSIKDEMDGTGLYKKYVDIGTDANGNTMYAEVVAADVVVGDTIAVTGPLTNTELRLTAVPVSIPASELHIGQVGGEGITISQTPTVTAAGIYAAGDAVGGLLTFANAARVSGGGGVIKNMIIIDDDKETGALELWLFNQTFSATADNAPFTVSDADLENCIGVISTVNGDWFAAADNQVADVEASKRYDLTGTSMFGQLVTRGTQTYTTTTDLTVKIALLRD